LAELRLALPTRGKSSHSTAEANIIAFGNVFFYKKENIAVIALIGSVGWPSCYFGLFNVFIS
jgi:hypothetical protein